jgi:hypothetical protein
MQPSKVGCVGAKAYLAHRAGYAFARLLNSCPTETRDWIQNGNSHSNIETIYFWKRFCYAV